MEDDGGYYLFPCFDNILVALHAFHSVFQPGMHTIAQFLRKTTGNLCIFNCGIDEEHIIDPLSNYYQNLLRE